MCADELICQTPRGVKLDKLADVDLQVRLRNACGLVGPMCFLPLQVDQRYRLLVFLRKVSWLETLTEEIHNAWVKHFETKQLVLDDAQHEVSIG